MVSASSGATPASSAISSRSRPRRSIRVTVGERSRSPRNEARSASRSGAVSRVVMATSRRDRPAVRTSWRRTSRVVAVDQCRSSITRRSRCRSGGSSSTSAGCRRSPPRPPTGRRRPWCPADAEPGSRRATSIGTTAGLAHIGDGLEERPVRLLHVLVAGTEQHPPTGGVHLGRQLGDETALAHPRLGRHDHQQGVPGDRALPTITEQIEFGDPPDEAIGIGQELQRRWQQRSPGPEARAPSGRGRGGRGRADRTRRACGAVTRRATPRCARR